MKLLTLLTTGLLTTIFLIGCNSEEVIKATNIKNKEVSTEVEFATPFEKKISDRITVLIDPKIEIANLVFEMLYSETGYTQTYGADSMEKQKAQFSKFRDHKIFGITLEMFENGFNYDVVPSVLHYYDDNLTLKENIIPDETIINRAGGYDQIDIYLEALYDFRKVSNFDAYFIKNEAEYQVMLNQAYNHITNTKMEETYIEYFGQSIGDVKIFLSPDSKHGYGCRNVYEDRVTLMPTLSVTSNEKDFLQFLLHEIGHSYINPQNEIRSAAVNELAYLYVPIKEGMAKQGYSNWETVLNEHIVRASVIDIMEIIYGEDVVDKLIEEEMEKKFVYMEEILDLLDEYKNNREKYINFDLYFNQLLNELKGIEI